MANCIFKIGSTTYANKAKRILSEYAIPVKIVRITGHATSGCTHGIEFNCANKNNVSRILSNYKLHFEEQIP